MDDDAIEVTRLAGSLGAEVRGLDLRTVTDADQVLPLLVEHQVLFFPGQHLSIDEHVSFGRLFGDIQSHPHLKNPFTDHDQIFELAASAGGVADEWHSDITFAPEPALFSILKVVECPDHGGDTMWASTYEAYDHLSAPMRDLCDGLTALHDAQPHGRSDKTAIHPVVRVHPATGRRALFVNEHFTRRIVELSAAESAAVLGFLTSWVTQPQFTVRYHWTPGTVAIWDNRCTQHCVLNDFDAQRIVQRVTVMGDRPEGVGAPRWEPYVSVGRPGAAGRLDRQLHRHLDTVAADGSPERA